jgi:ectoine hydroxylase-related dioxygenase (phytanoyl-CoA dioxygenase family)
VTSQNSQSSSFTFIQEHGYAVLPHAFSRPEISRLAFELSQSQLKRSRAGARHILSVAAVRNIADDARLLEIARAALGATAIPFRATLFDKSPASNWLVAWHQDTAMPLAEKIETHGWGPWSIKEGIIYSHAPKEALEQVLALRVHLDDSTVTNGPLRVLPGTHCDGVLTDLEIQERSSTSQSVECTVAMGGVIAMRPLVIHASSKSENHLPRRVLHIEYATRMEVSDELRLAIA